MKSSDVRLKLIESYYASDFSGLVERTALRVYDRQLAEDLVQDAFLRLLTSDAVVLEPALPGLVYRTITNLLYDRWRRRQHALLYRKALTASDVSDADSSAEVSVKQLTAVVEKAVSRLDDDSARIYCMNVFGDMKVSEIADKTGIQYKKVENKLYAARKAVRQYAKLKINL